jgi:acetylornithine deacetylase
MSSEDMLQKLVAFKTVSRDANEDLINFIAGALREAGGQIRVLAGNAPGKFNLLASFGPDNADGIILSGHSDVVPADRQSWASDPFTLTERAGRLHARGAADMKGFIACAITAAQRLAGKSLAQPLHIAISHDEETGCVGVRSMLATLADEKFLGRGCIIGEPTGMRIATGHKGKISGCIRCRGQAAHSANPDLGSNAIYLAAGMVAEVRHLQDWLLAHGARDAAYEVPHSTIHIGTIAGGTVLNIVPEFCDMAFEFRLLPGDMPEPLMARLRDAGARLAAVEVARGRFAAVEILEENAYPGLETSQSNGLVARARTAGGGNFYKAGFGTEAGLFTQTLGLPAIVCGPGDIDRAHKPDEFITREELTACDAFLDNIVQTLR